jgi:hypothetical protein
MIEPRWFYGSIFAFSFSIEAGQVHCFDSGRDQVAAHLGERDGITGLRRGRVLMGQIGPIFKI